MMWLVSRQRLSFRARLLTAALALACALVPRATLPAQTIELTRDIEAPALVQPTLAATIVGVLEKEAGELRGEADTAGDATARAVLLTRANLRLLAAELLAAGDRAGATGSGDVVRGLKLAVTRDAFDQALAARAAPGPDGTPAPSNALDALASFNHGFEAHVQRGEAAAAPASSPGSDWLAGLLVRLTAVVADPDGKPLQSHWIAPPANAAAATQPIESTPLALLRRRADATSVSEPTRANLLSILDFLERGRQFPELAGRIGDYQRIVSVFLDTSDTIAVADWLTEAQRGAMQEQVSAAVEAFLDPQRRPSVIEAAERLDAWRRFLAAASGLEDDNVETKTIRSVFAALETADQQAADQRDAVRILTQTTMVLERMVEARNERPEGLTRELRIVQRDVLRDYRETEAKVLKELAAGALAHGSLADPGLSSLLADHRERVEDLRRLRRLPEWIAAISRIYPPAAKDFEINMRKRAQSLLEPTKQPDARLAMNRFEQELALFERLPAEQALQENRPAAGELTGGLQAPMLALITEKRRAWVDDWSRAEQSPEPAKVMGLLHRLMQSLRDAAALVEVKPAILNRWPAWQLSETVIEAGQSDVATRLRLACAAATSGDFAALAEQVDRIDRESPVTKVAGRLMSRLGNDLSERPGGAEGVIAQLTRAPPGDAYFIRWKDDIARLCRYAAEAAAARDAGNATVARECDEYINALAKRLLEQ